MKNNNPALEVVDFRRIFETMPGPSASGQTRLLVYDATRLEQVLNNLVSNAFKYSPSGSLVAVGLEQTDSEVIIWVRDQGQGISPEQQTHIFDRFYRVRTENNREVQGLGLYISYEIIKAHRGRMWIESQVGQGSTFFIALPAQLDRVNS